MTFQPGNMSYAVAVGASPNAVSNPHLDVRAPTASDVLFNIGQIWIDTVGQNAYALVAKTSLGGVIASVWKIIT